MKTKTPLLLLILIVLTFNSCVSKSQYDQVNNQLTVCNEELSSLSFNCESCKFEKPPKPRLPENTDLSINFDVTNSYSFQTMQYDLLNGYGIVGKVTDSNDDGIDKMIFSTYEVGTCDRYYIKDVTNEKLTQEDIDLGFKYKFKFRINNKTLAGNHSQKNPTLYEKLTLNPSNKIRIIVTSDNDPRIINSKKELEIATENAAADMKESFKNFDFIFPPFDCPVRVSK